jgi:aryl-alcohol dehydrogenase-like predicted oxidoreductase
MRTRRFGSTELSVSEFGLGCARIGGIFQKGGSGFIDLLAAARDAGITFFDTSDIYSQGESETLIGRAFRGKRDQIVIASKAGYCLPARRKLVARLKPLVRPIIQRLGIRRDRLPAAVRGSVSQDFTPAYLRRAVEGSLRRLRTDYLDLFQLHSPPAEIIERGDWASELDALRRDGKIRYYGVSCDSIETGVAALRFPNVSSLQFPVSLLEQRFADALLPNLRERKVAAIARECLANGLLVKRAEEIELEKFYPSADERARRSEELARHRARALSEKSSLARLALGYANGLDGVSVALIGVKSTEQLRGILKEVP